MKLMRIFRKRKKDVTPFFPYNIKLTVKSIIRTEQLLNKPFSKLDYSNEKEVTSLLYCIVLTNNDISMTYEEFIHIIGNETQLSRMLTEFERYNKVANQFQCQVNEDIPTEDNDMSFIKDIVSTLIVDAGLNVNYVLNDMPLSDIQMYAQAYERKKKEEMEASRLWTYLSILPHVDTKKLKSAQDLYMFPWEVEQAKKDAEQAIRENRERFEALLKQGKIKINHGK